MNRVPGKARLCGALALILVAAGPLRCGTPIISEFMASNNTTLTDQDGDYADWLELYNPGPSGVNLGGWFLTNKADAPAKWQIPSVTLPAGGYLVIFCSQKNYIDPGAPLATNFNLSSGGGYVGLVEADGKTVASSYTFPVQYPDISYGVSQPASAAEAPQTGYLEVATPGAANGGYANVLLGDTVTISAPAGFFSSAASVTLGGATGAEHIRYVLAGPTSQGDQVAPPSASSQLYTGPITVSSTALLSAAVFSADDTQRGLPSTAMYVQLDAASANRVDTFTSNLPILVYDDNGFGLLPNNHIFYPAWFGAFSPGSDGSATLVQSPDFFTSDTMKLHGFSSASWPKQSYEVSLSDDFGRALPMPLLGLAADKSWDNISLWNIDRTYIHNPFVYSLFRSMGHWAPQARPAEMFIHPSGGVLDYTSYSGITNVTERLKVEANRVNIASIGPGDVAPPAVTGGYLLRIDHPKSRSGTYKYYTWTTSDGTTLFVDTPKLDVLVKPQIDYITGYIQQMQDAMAEDKASGYATRNYLNYLDR
ncbi:MAG TPA: lamin tail domain-containing protein, partial [Opitutaceae bacterium]